MRFNIKGSGRKGKCFTRNVIITPEVRINLKFSQGL
jgi:hypothetical protein